MDHRAVVEAVAIERNGSTPLLSCNVLRFSIGVISGHNPLIKSSKSVVNLLLTIWQNAFVPRLC